MLEAVLFDLDGTLISYAAPYADFVLGFAHQWGITDPGDPFHLAYAAAIQTDGPVTFRSSVEFALTRTGYSPPKNLAEACDKSVADYASGIQLLPGALELVASYGNLPKAIVSNGPADMQRAAIAAARLTHLFDQTLISGDPDVAVRKPDAKIFQLACQRLAVCPERTLMIGDNEAADIEGARAAGLKATHVSNLTTTNTER
jgi:putative hydrolase of the HAD superfamily